MKIKTINISNFKSFDNLEVNLRDFNVVVGANASGKTNFTQIFRFLRDIGKEGLKNAVSIHGGEYFRNINLNSDIFSLEMDYSSYGEEFSCYLKLKFKNRNEFLIEDTITALNKNVLCDDSIDNFSDISIYDFNPKLPQQAIPLTGKSELEEDGRNLPIVLRNLLENEEDKKKFFNILSTLLPSVKDLNVEPFVSNYLVLKLKEKYSEEYLPANLMSDGTISLVALIIAMFFEEKPVIIIEEPERNIHPALFSNLISLMKEASKQKQIIITTHNPEIIKHAFHEDPESLLLISRDKKGFSQISRPANNENLRNFLNNDIGIDDLFIDDLLGI